MSRILKTVDSLEDKLKDLFERYEFLKEENEILLANIDSLQKIHLRSKEELEAEKERYRLLKIAKTIDGSREDSRETKLKINALIREIDKCLVKLNQ